MNISNKALVAVDALVALHQNRQRSATSLVTLSSLLNVSVSYLEFIFKELRTAGLVSASRGPGGGYQLTAQAGGFDLQSLCQLFQNLDDLEADEPIQDMSAELFVTNSLLQRAQQVRREFLAEQTLETVFEESDRLREEFELKKVHERAMLRAKAHASIEVRRSGQTVKVHSPFELTI
jgi:Rrf2 family iron-sulfur cluster assembly transcriptional regulator